MLKEELELLKNFAIHDWDRRYIEQGMARTAFLFKIISQYVDLEDKMVLDLGCGIGNVSILGSQCSSCIVGLDISSVKLKRAKWRLSLRRLRKPGLVNGDALRLPFAGGVFDLVITYDLYEHVSDKHALLEEIFRVTSKNGFLVLTTGNRLFPLDRHTLLWFVDYLPKKLANQYVRLMNRRRIYDVSQPSYWSLWKKFRKYFRIVTIDGDSALKMIEDVYPEYLERYWGIVPLLESLVKMGIFKFITPKYIVISQKIRSGCT